MIKINLAPAEELDSPYWWVGDAITFAAVLGIAMLVSYLFLGNIRSQISVAGTEKEKLDAENETLKADVDRYASLSREIADLQRIKESYSRITETKLTRYLPIIILEHLQNLKPQGVWFTKVEFLADEAIKAAEANATVPAVAAGTPPATEGAASPTGNPNNPAAAPAFKDHYILIQGNALNNVILGEFMTIVQATQNQELDPGDLRSQAYFKSVNLGFSKAKRLGSAKQTVGETSTDVVEFELRVPYSERRQEDVPVDAKLSRLMEGKRPQLKILK